MVNMLSEFQANHLTLHNRLILPPLASEKADATGNVTQATLDHYDEKTHGGYFAMVIVEHCFVTPQGRATRRQLSIAADETVDGLSKLVETIHKNGSKAVAQINHAGGAASQAITGMDMVTPSDVPSKKGEVSCILDVSEIQEIIALFAKAAGRAKAAGFDGVEIHSAHGYLLNQFYSPLTNKRVDEYGGDVAGRTKIHQEVISAIRSEVGKNFPILLRIGACDYIEGGNTITDAIQAVKVFEIAGIDILDVSGGMNGSVLKGKEDIQGFYSDVTQAIKQISSLPVILTGGITDIHAANDLIKLGKADFIGVGRAMLRDSNWAETAFSDLLML